MGSSSNLLAACARERTSRSRPSGRRGSVVSGLGERTERAQEAFGRLGEKRKSLEMRKNSKTTPRPSCSDTTVPRRSTSRHGRDSSSETDAADIARVEADAADGRPESATEQMDQEWSASKWIKALNLNEIVASALLDPILELMPSGLAQFSYVKALSREELRHLLQARPSAPAQFRRAPLFLAMICHLPAGRRTA